LEEVDPADEARTYREAPLWRRLSIDVAGSAMHFLIALVVLFAMFFWTGDRGFYLSAPASNPIVEISRLQSGLSPAQEAGFHLGDRILAVNGNKMSWAQLGDYIRTHPGQRIDMTVERAGRIIHLFPVPVKADTVQIVGSGEAPSGGVGFIGIA